MDQAVDFDQRVFLDNPNKPKRQFSYYISHTKNPQRLWSDKKNQRMGRRILSDWASDRVEAILFCGFAAESSEDALKMRQFPPAEPLAWLRYRPNKSRNKPVITAQYCWFPVMPALDFSPEEKRFLHGKALEHISKCCNSALEAGIGTDGVFLVRRDNGNIIRSIHLLSNRPKQEEGFWEDPMAPNVFVDYAIKNPGHIIKPKIIDEEFVRMRRYSRFANYPLRRIITFPFLEDPDVQGATATPSNEWRYTTYKWIVEQREKGELLKTIARNVAKMVGPITEDALRKRMDHSSCPQDLRARWDKMKDRSKARK